MSEIPRQNYEQTQTSREQSSGISEGGEIQESIIPAEIQQKLELARWDEAKGDKAAEYQKFTYYITTLSPEEREKILMLIQNSPERKLSKYIQENGFIINQETQASFEGKFGKKTQELQIAENKQVKGENEQVKGENEQVKGENEQVKGEKSRELTKIKSFTDIFVSRNAQFSDIPEFQKLIERAQNLTIDSDIQEITELNQDIKSFLSDTRSGNLEKIATTFKQNHDEVGYEAFKTYANSLDPSFNQRFISFEENYGASVETSLDSDLRTAQVMTGLGARSDGDFEKYGNIVERTANGQVTRMNIGDIPPTRTIGLEGSSLRIDTDVPIGDLYPAIAKEGLAYEKASAENMPKISRLKALESSQVQEFLTGEEFQKESLANCIRIISTLIGLPADMKLSDLIGKEINSKEGLVSALSPSSVFSRKQELEKEIQEKKGAYQKALASHMNAYHESIRERDEIAKKALQICKNAGFDMLDIDFIMSQLSGSMVPNIGVSFDKKNIDIATLNFGQPETEAANESNFAQRIYRTMNMILFKNPNGTDVNGNQIGFDLATIARNPQGQLKTQNDIKTLLERQGILNPTTGVMNKQLVMQRFTQGIKGNTAR